MQQPSELHRRASAVDSAGKALARCLEAWDAALERRAPLAEKLKLQRRTYASARRLSLSLAKGYLALARVTACSDVTVGAAR